MSDISNSALIVIDIQGKLATLMHNQERFLHNAQVMIKAAHILGIPVLWAEQSPNKLGNTVAEISQLMPNQQAIEKTSFSCCGTKSFTDPLKHLERNHCLIIGIETHVCVYQTVNDLLKQPLSVHVVSDACASRTPENKHIGLNRMEREGAIISSVEMCLFELMKDANHPNFRAISQLLR